MHTYNYNLLFAIVNLQAHLHHIPRSVKYTKQEMHRRGLEARNPMHIQNATATPDFQFQAPLHFCKYFI